MIRRQQPTPPPQRRPQPVPQPPPDEREELFDDAVETPEQPPTDPLTDGVVRQQMANFIGVTMDALVAQRTQILMFAVREVRIPEAARKQIQNMLENIHSALD